ncbi:nicotinate-nucleotide--dimethylbenzimidazole phosphoribosyltransferase [Micromonospora sp. M12]
MAVATGVLLGATARRVPVLLDGPVGMAAGMVSRDLAGQARHWCLLADHGGHPAVRLAADVLGLTRCSTCGSTWARARTRWSPSRCCGRCWRWPPRCRCTRRWRRRP